MRKRIISALIIILAMSITHIVHGSMLKTLPADHWAYSALSTFGQKGLLPTSVLKKIENADLYGWEVSKLVDRITGLIEQQKEWKEELTLAEEELLALLKEEFPSEKYLNNKQRLALEAQLGFSNEKIRELKEEVEKQQDVLTQKNIRAETRLRGSYQVDAFYVDKTGPRWVYIGAPIDRTIDGGRQHFLTTRQTFNFNQDNQLGQAWDEWLPVEYMSKSKGGNYSFGLGAIQLKTESDRPNSDTISISGYPWARFTTRISIGIFEAYLGYRYAAEFTPFTIAYPDGGSYGYGGLHLYWSTDSRWGFRYMYGIDRTVEPFRIVEAAKATFRLPVKDISTLAIITSRLFDDPLGDSKVLSAVFYRQMAPTSTRRMNISAELAHSQLDMDWQGEPSAYMGIAKRLDVNIETLNFPVFKIVPFNFLIYDISPTFLSRPGGVWNVSLPDITGGGDRDWARSYDPNRLPGLRVLENNRQGFNARAKVSFSRFSRLTRDCSLQIDYSRKKQKELDATGDPLSKYDGYLITFEYNIQELLRLTKPLKVYLQTQERNRYFDLEPDLEKIRRYTARQVSLNSMISNKVNVNYKYTFSEDHNLVSGRITESMTHELLFKVLVGVDLGFDFNMGYSAGRDTSPNQSYDGFWIGARTSKSF